ncbi:efflux RND transporter periplasmic adaptor subunit [Aquabacterium sp. CECT 9606]|uniref:efflux RND transporter periplasmic adaptor subunit n=1 Tax=Aquabacterium sp. CECT 9606 TaxID=2845822 RepID=UPI001E5AC2FF|nr:efflux RND transporter periplasmic adaptor subunit [Aquabacterium sp. CECT 9606]CAH0352374.1 Multidrug resistance protein MdtA [Aquabacterium sp. CECT 9606]
MSHTLNRPFRTSAAIAIITLLILAACSDKQAATSDKAASAQEGAETTTPSVLTVEVVSPTTLPWPQTIQANGTLAAWQEVIVSPETGGLRIAELLVDVGSRVKRGQVLARLADESLQNDLHKQQAVLAQAQASLNKATSNLRRYRMVETTGGLSAQSIEEAKINEATARASLASAKADLDAAELKLRQSRIVAPDDGLVSSRTGVLGNVVSAGTELFRLVRQGRIEWQGEVDARQLSAIRAGQRVSVTLPDGQAVDGRLRLVGPVLSTSTGRALVYVSLPTDSPAKVGMFGKGSIELPAQAAVTLPQTALVARDGRDYVYLVDKDSKVTSMVVTVGRRQQQRVEVVGGLAPNARVVTSGGAFLSDGAKVTVATSPSAAPAASGNSH